MSVYNRHMFHNPQIDSIYRRGNNGAGVLIIHGFTGTPDSMRPMVNHLHDEGFTVSAPLLAGHGLTAEHLSESGWIEWFQSVQQAFKELQESCSKVFACGLSLGSLLTLKLAIEFPQHLSAISCLATPLYLPAWVQALVPMVVHSPLGKIWKYQKKMKVDIKDPVAANNFWNIDKMPVTCIHSILKLQENVVENLKQIHSPLLLIHSRHDSTAPYDSMPQVAEQVSSVVCEMVTLENSYHVITIDYEKDLVAQKVATFFKRFL